MSSLESSPSPSTPSAEMTAASSIYADDIPLEFRYIPDLPIIDEAAWFLMCGGDVTFSAELLRDFVEECDSRSADLSDCRRGLQSIYRAMEPTYGTVASHQLCALRDVTARLMDLGRRIQSTDADPLFADSPLLRAKLLLLDGYEAELERLRTVIPRFDELARLDREQQRRQEEEDEQAEADAAQGWERWVHTPSSPAA